MDFCKFKWFIIEWVIEEATDFKHWETRIDFPHKKGSLSIKGRPIIICGAWYETLWGKKGHSLSI